MLGKMIKYNASGVAHGSGLASGVNVQNVPQGQRYVQKIMKSAGKVPKSASPQSVMNAIATRDKMKADAKFVNDMVDVKLEQVDAALEVYEAHVAMDEGLAKRETKYQQITDKYSRSTLNTRYDQGRIQAGNQGNYVAYTKQSRFADL